MQKMRALSLAMGLALTSLISNGQNPIDPYKYLATLEFDGDDWSVPMRRENVFPVRFDFNTTQDANNDGKINPEDNLENIIEYAIGNNLTGTGRTGLTNRGPNDQRPAVYYHYVDIYPWRVHQYWLYYADNDWWNDHEHDWEVYFVYTINGVPTHVAYSGHGFITIETWCDIQKDQIDPSHPRLGVDGGAHAMKNTSEDGVRIRFNGVIEKRNGRLNFNVDTIPWVIYSNDSNVINVVPYVQDPDTFWYKDPFYGGGEYGDPRDAPWQRPRWTNPETPSAFPAFPSLPDTIYKCINDTVVLDAGPGGSSYLWNTGETTRTINVTTPGKYWVDVTSRADGCTYTIPDTVVIVNFPVPDPTTIIPQDTVYKCYYTDSVLITADSGYIYYSWNTGHTTQTISVDSQGVYVAYVLDSFGCPWKDSIWVIEVPYAPSFSVDTLKDCNADSITLSAGVGSSYLWNTGDTTQSIVVHSRGEFIVKVFDSLGCVHPDTITVLLPNALLDLGPTEFFICLNGDSVVLTANDGFVEYLWNTGDTTRQIIVRLQGEYIVKAMDSIGCLYSDTVRVWFYPFPDDIIPVSWISKCRGDTVRVEAKPIFISYLWNTGDTTHSVQIVQPGTYYLEVVDTFGCKYVDSVTVSDSTYQRGLFFSSLSSDGRCYVAVYQNIDSVIWQLDSLHLGSSDSICVPHSGLLCVYGFSLCYVDTFCNEVYVTHSDSDTVSGIPLIRFAELKNCEIVEVFDVGGRRLSNITECAENTCIIRFSCLNKNNLHEIRTFKVVVPQGIRRQTNNKNQ
ncbi:MAG: hypothetical protein GXO48_06110 [Chlorobi bacterium]|nr:hypothetical protein [Chlorobiota bacterium]